MNCINCGTAAKWTFKNTGVSEQHYCERHLPRGYRRLSGLEPVKELADADAITVSSKGELEESEAKGEPSEESPKPKPRPRKRTTASKAAAQE